MSFVINRWVRGKDFVGRGEHLEALRQEGLRTSWILGNRRVGKSSLLRQVEWLCREGYWPDQMALYWDLQGSGNVEGLRDSFLEALEDAEEVAEELDLDLDALEEATFQELINRFRRRVKTLKGKRCYLLIDECEELVDVAAGEPAVLAVFRKLTHGSRNLTIVMAGSMRMYDLDESQARTSPFLPDFLPPRLLGPFSEEESLKVLMSKGLEETVSRDIHRLTLGNPHLVALLGEHYERHGDLDLVLEEIKHGKAAFYFFNSNFMCLPDEMRAWWEAGNAAAQIAALPVNHPHFAYVRQSALAVERDGRVHISPLLQWLETGGLDPATAPQPPVANASPGPAPPRAEDPVFQLLRGFARRDKPLSAMMPAQLLAADDPAEWIQSAQEPPSLELVQSLRDPEITPDMILAGATPEYLNQVSGDARTQVYLVGLYLYHRFVGHAPGESYGDLWERAGFLAENDIVLSDAEVARFPDRRLAMVTARCLKVRPDSRYSALSALETDLKTVF
ncbi:AAA family ATPase [Acanthopleuribacter pedis]|uniref:ORC1/DEAH AAA+ ATPase domain-containing protein n=1 Tax=Acanthopleuribacter pedis TaxID=442870 RepID=A0A8J7U2H5_9BACT|nr:AAA family ATPase [Acanthopleuribacter pedis]MBO1317295.1 hypothetical protein [Acanthopleuribacter pedis]MBO1318602.1 hypothetical protein [Acanthopleuribacter pedis]